MKSYGIINDNDIDAVDLHLESLKRKGFSIIKSVLSKDECEQYSESINRVYRSQEERMGSDKLEVINELNVARMPFLEDDSLFTLIDLQRTLAVVESFIGPVFQLHLQNAIINRPNLEHHQSSWHRDLPYQHWVISKPLAVNIFFCLTDFNRENGATQILPYSQHFEDFPSDNYAQEHAVSLDCKAGDVVCFDSMLFHRAGENKSKHERIGVNHVFTVPIIKPQIMVAARESDDRFNTLMGKTFDAPSSVDDYRRLKLGKSGR